MNLKANKRLFLKFAHSRGKWILPIGFEIIGLLVFMIGFFYYLRFAYISKSYPRALITRELAEVKIYHYEISGYIMTFGNVFLLSGFIALLVIIIINLAIKKERVFATSDFNSTIKSRIHLRSYLKYPLLLVPLFVPFVFYHIYQPINQEVIVEHFGCGCPKLDVNFDYNANDFNASIWIVLSFLNILLWLYLIKRTVTYRLKIWVELIGVYLIILFSLRYYAGSCWL